jgi:hypothetical protein
MNVLFYKAGPNGGAEQLMRSLAGLVPGDGLKAYSDLGSFSERIRMRRDPDSIAIIWNPSHEDLRALGSLRDRLQGGRILLALADQEKETIALAHALLPAYITYLEDGHSKVLSVLRKLAGVNERDQGPGIRS